MELKKIDKNIWEIPKEGMMNVPAIIFASDKLAEKIKQDKTIEQARNVACLKGIQKAAYTMPDAHQGYGFPIGGVAAFDPDEGIISPGGVGYDINCLTADSKVLTEHGFYKRMDNFEESFVEIENVHPEYILKSKKALYNICSMDLDEKQFTSKEALFFMKKKHEGKILSIRTMLGYNIKLTKEHPILTESGMKKAENLKQHEKIAILPFNGVEYEEIKHDIDLLERANLPVHQKEELEKRGLYPLRLSNTKIPIIAKLFGYLLGDGNIYFSHGKGSVCAYGAEQDLNNMKKDIEELGFSARLYSRIRNHKIMGKSGMREFISENFELHVSSSSLANLFYHLGYPIGKKASTKFEVPYWIMQSPKWIKRLFLSALFGAELSSPKTHTKTGFSCPVFSMSKNQIYADDGRSFCIQIMNILKEFEVEIDKITQKEDLGNKLGRIYRIKIQLSSNEENLLRLWSKIGFSYNKKRELLSHIAILYIQEKKMMTDKRTKIADAVKELKKKGLKLTEVQAVISKEFVNSRFIERHYYENAKQRINLDFLSFIDFKQAKISEIKKDGIFFDSISCIDYEEYDGYVYDLNIPDTHNFIANNIIVSNCGVRLIRTDLMEKDVTGKRQELLDAMYENVPPGVGRNGKISITKEDLTEIMKNGSEWALNNGYAKKEDLESTEEYGKIKGAEPKFVSSKAFERGITQLGTLGAGNHFLEIQKVEEIFDDHAAKAFGINRIGQIMIMVHCGSRGFGHQIASDYIKEMEDTIGTKDLPDRELVCAPIKSELGKKYYGAMCCAINFAFCNRQMITYQIREAFKKVMGTDKGLELVYDVCHNIAKFEKHTIDGKQKEVCVHRKGATRSFGPGREEIPKKYREIGQPVLIPGSMGTASYVLVGTKKAEEVSFGSTAHGAGRVSSRTFMLNNYRGEKVKQDLEKIGVTLKSKSWKGVAEEAPQAYKDVNEVVKVSDEIGIGKLVVKLKPIAVMKG